MQVRKILQKIANENNEAYGKEMKLIHVIIFIV